MPSRRSSRQLMIFVPEGRRASTAIPVDLQDQWVVRLLRECAALFGGGTAYGCGVGVWTDGEATDADVHWDRVTVVECWISPALRDWKGRLGSLMGLLHEMRCDLNEQVVACILNGEWIPLKERHHGRSGSGGVHQSGEAGGARAGQGRRRSADTERAPRVGGER